MKVFFIVGTGLISTSVSKMAVEKGIDLYLFNRGERGIFIDGAKRIQADIKKCYWNCEELHWGGPVDS